MTWENRTNNIKFSITTGDGKQYFPLWKSGEKTKEFNTTEFNFIDVKGTLVERKKPKSGKFPLVFWFQGADNIDQAEVFERSAEDNRQWTITHPFYGTIKGHPTSISRNDEYLNITEISVDFWESIDADYPKSNFSVKDNTREKRETVQAVSAKVYSANPIFKSADISKNQAAINKAAKPLGKLQSNSTFAEYSTKVNAAVKANNNLVNGAFDAITKTQEILNMPGDLVTSVNDRINGYKSVFAGLVTVLESVPDKLFFQSMGGSCIASMCETSSDYVFGVDYMTISDVESVSSDILGIYELYLSIVDGASTSNYETTDHFTPDPLLQSEIHNLVMFTVGNIYQLVFEAKQERIIYTDKPTNLILLCHKYMGSVTDDNIETLRFINNIKLNEVFRIEKGRQIKYYI